MHTRRAVCHLVGLDRRYCPEQNPIEEMFSQAKAKVIELSYFTAATPACIDEAFASITEANAINYYAHAGYALSDEATAVLRNEGRL